ncbi:hypothetical protein A0H81_03939 [Grifola frondosa]|uniref:Uncharacterized protein n=1 Tax=Grifola frondosa TaxID=5627 RepID=A0A1C7MJT9_GRIFR|nr:hypothetical protein A0H81_03939 [Grifola frondosa]
MADIDSCISESSLAPSTTQTSLLDSTSQLAHSSVRTSKNDRRVSLGLIDAARVKLSKDVSSTRSMPALTTSSSCLTRVVSPSLTLQFHSLIRSNSKSQRVRAVLSVQAEESEDQRFLFEGDAIVSSHLVDLDIAQMELASDERPGRGFGAKVRFVRELPIVPQLTRTSTRQKRVLRLNTQLVNFLNRSRSRSRSKKRRSRSLEPRPVEPMPVPVHTGSLRLHVRHSSLEDQPGVCGASTSGSRPVTRSPSRPLSITAATNATITPRARKAHEAIFVPPLISPQIVPHAGVVSLEPTPSSSSRKGKRMNIFGIVIPSPRKASFGDLGKSKSRPTTPAPASDKPTSNGHDRRFWSGNSGSQRSQRSQDDSHKYPVLHGDRNAMQFMIDGKLFDNGKPTRPNVVAPQPRHAPILVLNSPPRPSGEYLPDADSSDLGGRCSPLCGLVSSKQPNSPTDKGKERERPRGSRERERDDSREKRKWKEKEKERERDKERERERDRITHPRRVGSPTPRSSSAVARRSYGEDRQWKQQTERRKRRSDGAAIRNIAIPESNPLWLHRSHSTKTVPSRRDAIAPTKPLGSAPNPTQDRGKKPILNVKTPNMAPVRRPTDSSTGTSAYHRPPPALYSRTNSNPHHSDTDPASPVSSHSGASSGLNSSWGRSGGKRIVRASHGPFKFEPAVPPIPGSPAFDERKSAARTGSNGTSSPLAGSPPSKSKQARASGKGRSLDLGLGLSWAPSRVREEAVLQLNGARAGVSMSTDGAMRARSRWRSVDEEGRLAKGGSASDVADAFKEVLGDAAYAIFKNYVHRFDANAIPLDGPSGLLLHVQRLLDSAPGLDERRKRQLLDKFVRVVRENR